MLTAREFVARWGHPEAFVSYDLDIVRSLDIPEETKAFLIDPGMPSDENMFFIRNNRLPMLEEMFGAQFEQEEQEFDPECRHMRVLGTQDDGKPDCGWTAVLLDDRQDGRIFDLGFDPAGKLYPTFCNSTLRQFAEYQLIFKEFAQWIQEQEDYPEWIRCQTEVYAAPIADAFVTKVEAYGRGIAIQLRAIDPVVSAAADSFWTSEEYNLTGRFSCSWALRINALEKGWLTTYF